MLTHTIAAVLLEFGYLSVGLALCFMGQRLLERGIEGRTKVEGEIAGGKWMLVTSSPGIVFAVCGLGIIIYAIATPSVYEKKVSVSEQRSDSNGTKTSPGEGPQASAVTTTQTSRLFQQPSAEAALSSRVAIYAMQHRGSSRVDQDVAAELQKMPTEAEVEPWSETYQRFGILLRKNPTALLKMLNQPQFKWLAAKDREEGSLTDLITLESVRLGAANTKQGEK